MTDQRGFEEAVRSGLAGLAAAEPAPPGLAERLVSHSVDAPRRLSRSGASRSGVRRWLAPVASAGLVAAAALVAVVVARPTHHAAAPADPAAPSSTIASPSSGPAPGTGPVFTAVPAAGSLTPATCAVPPVAVGGHDLATVDRAPSNLTIAWYFGPKAACGPIQLTVAGPARAVQLADQVRAASAASTGSVYCPDDDHSGAVLYFTYAGQPSAETVTVNFSGCSVLNAPGRRPRAAGSVITGLLPLRPPVPGPTSARPS